MNLKRSLALAISVLMILSMPLAFGATDNLKRISGANRYETAVAISQEGWGSATVVVLARGDNFADALAGVPLAYKLDAPILLTQSGSLPSETKTEIARLGATKVILLGGTGAISKAVADELASLGLIVERIAGEDRFDTAAKIAEKVAPGAATVVLASGRDFPDALAAAPYAAAKGFPILLTEKNSLPDKTKAALTSLNPSKIIVAGGTAAVSANVFDAVSTRNPVRVAGANRYATAVKLAEFFGLSSDSVYLASGRDFPDAITGAALAAKQGTGIFLVGTSLDSTVGNYLTNNPIAEAIVFGGTGAVSASVATAVADKLAPAGGTGVAGWTTPGATVKVAGKTVTASRQNGFYKVTGIPAGAQTVTISKPTLSTERAVVNVAKDKVSVFNKDLTALTRASIAIHGVVLNKDTGAPVGFDDPADEADVQANIYLEYYDTVLQRWVYFVDVDADPATGTFTINNTNTGGLNFGMKVYMWVTYQRSTVADGVLDQYHSLEREFVLATDSNDNYIPGLELTRVKSMSISGKVEDRGFGVDGATVELRDEYGDYITHRTTANGGNYAFNGQRLTSGNYYIVTTATGFAADVKTVSVTEGVNLTHNVALVPGYQVAFVLRPEEAEFPVGTPAVFGAGKYRAALLKDGIRITKGDVTVAAEGAASISFSMEDLVASGAYTLRVTGKHAITKDFPITVTNTAKVADGRTFLAGSVTGEIKGANAYGVIEPLEAKVELLDHNKTVLKTYEIPWYEGGKYAFNGLAPGKYNVRVSMDGYVTKLKHDIELDPTDPGYFPLVKNEAVVANFELERIPSLGRISGFVRTDITQTPAVGAKIYYYALNVVNPATGGLFPQGTEIATAEVEANGSYELTDLPTGLYQIVIRDDGKHEYNVSTRTITAGNNGKTVNYSLQPGGKAKLTINLTNNSLTNPYIEVRDAYGLHAAWPWTGTTKDSPANASTITVNDLSAGTYTVIAWADDHVESLFTVTVGKNAEVSVNHRLTPKAETATVNLKIYGKDFATVNGRYVISGVATSFDLTNDVVIQLPKGTHVITFYVNEYIEHSVTVVVGANDVGSTINVPVINLTKWK